MKKRHLVIDTPNLLFRTASAHNKYAAPSNPEDQAGLAMHMALNALKSHYNKIKPDTMAVVFEGRENWRKAYTRSAECVSKRLYKGNRVKDDSMLVFFQLIESFEALVREHSSIQCLSHPKCEGDDLFAGYAEYHCGRGDEVFGLSGDKDYVQLLDIDGFTLLNPDKLGADRSKDKKGNPINAKYFMFEKAFRGDAGDNVMSAYPRVRSTRLQKAYTSDYELTNLLNETWDFADPATGDITTFRVGDLYNENQLLMNLRGQPEYIRDIINHNVVDAENHVGKFSIFHFSKFCGKFGLKKVGDDISSFAPMFANVGFNNSIRQDLIEQKEAETNQQISEPTENDAVNNDIINKLRNKSKTKANTSLLRF